MSIAFITEDPVGKGYDAQLARNVRTRQEQERQGVDAALRAGIGDMLAQPTAAPSQTSTPSDYIAPLSQGSTGTAAPPQRIDTSDATQDDYAVRTALAEDGASPEGMAGVLHVIRNRLASGKWGGDVGSVVLAPSQFSPWNPGSTNDPRRFDVNSPQYQAALARWQAIKAGQEQDPTGGALHFANPAASTASWVQPAVQSGKFVRVGNHHFFQGLDVGVPQAPGSAMPDYAGTVVSSAMPAAAPAQGARPRFDYEPIIQRLAATPGGGRAALPLLNQANRTDIAMGRRSDQYAKLVGQALLNGNVQAAQYYGQLSGIQLPPQLLADAGAMKRTGVALRLTTQFYAGDPARAQAFAQAYVRTGSIDQAFAVAGPPADKPQISLQWLRDGEREALYGVNTRTGTAAPITMAPGQPAAPNAAAPAGNSPPPAPPGQVQPPGAMPPGSPYGTNNPNAGAPVGGYSAPQPGQPITRDAKPVGRGGIGRASVWEQKVKAMKDAGMSDQEIGAVAAGQAGRPVSAATVISLRNAVGREAQLDLSLDTPKKKQAYIDNAMSGIIPNWQSILQRAGGGGGGSAYQPPQAGFSATAGAPPASATGAQQAPNSTAFSAPQPAAPPAAAPQQPSQAFNGKLGSPTVAPPRPSTVPVGALWSYSRQMWKDQAGNVYDAFGKPLQARGE